MAEPRAETAEPMASEKPATPASPGYDHFTSGPWITVLCLWIVAVLPPIFLGVGGILPSHWLMLSILVIPVATVLRLILLIVNLFHLQWRAATSIVFASAAFALATFGSLEFSGQPAMVDLNAQPAQR